MGYQVEKEEKEKDKDKIDEADETDESDDEEETIPEWVRVSKDRFDVIRGLINTKAGNRLSNKVDNETITLNNARKMIIDTASGKIDRDEAVDMYKSTIPRELVRVKDSLSTRNTETRRKMIDTFMQLREIPFKSITDDETGDDEQPDTTYITGLDNEESAEQETQEGQESKILIPNQKLSILPINLAQLKVGNNSEKLENEIRQLLYSLYRSKKYSKQSTII